MRIILDLGKELTMLEKKGCGCIELGGVGKCRGFDTWKDLNGEHSGLFLCSNCRRKQEVFSELLNDVIIGKRKLLQECPKRPSKGAGKG